MAAKRRRGSAVVGVAENGNDAVLVTVAAGKLLDRRTVSLTPRGTPTHPHHHEGSWAVGRYLETPGARPMPLAEAVALVERVRAAATTGAERALAGVADAVSTPIAAITLRVCPELPPTTEAKIRDNRAQTMADSAMYRELLAAAAVARGWAVHWYDRDEVLRDLDAVRDVLDALGRSAGPPWQARHKLAAAAALVIEASKRR